MAVAQGPDVAGDVDRLAEALRDVASLLYDADQSPSLAVLDQADQYTGRTFGVLADLEADRAWLWPAYTALRERIEQAREHLEARQYDAARERLIEPVRSGEIPSHRDAFDLASRIAETARSVTDVAMSVAPKIGEVLSVLAEARTNVGALEERAAMLGISRHASMIGARSAVERAFAQVTTDPLGTDASEAVEAVQIAAVVVDDADARLRALPDELDAADVQIYEIEVLIQRGRDALERAREKIVKPQGLLVPMTTDVLSAGPRGLRPWWNRLVEAIGEGDNRAAILGVESWKRLAADVRTEAQRIADANEAPIRRRDELRGLLGALWAKAAASGWAENQEVSQLHEDAREALYQAPCSLQEAERRVDAFRRHIARR